MAEQTAELQPYEEYAYPEEVRRHPNTALIVVGSVLILGAGGYLLYSYLKKKKTPSPSTTPATPSTPVYVSSMAYSATSADLTISWTAVPGATSYQVWHEATTQYPQGYVTTVTSTSATIPNLYPGSPYHVAVKACNGALCSGLSPYASLQTKAWEG